MPRYYFDIHDGKGILDEEGTELAGPEEARQELVRLVGELLRENLDKFWSGHDWRVDASDEQRQRLFSLNFSAMIDTNT